MVEMGSCFSTIPIDSDLVVRGRKGDSGHYEPYGGTAEKQQAIFERNKSALQENGLNTDKLLADDSQAWNESYERRMDSLYHTRAETTVTGRTDITESLRMTTLGDDEIQEVP